MQNPKLKNSLKKRSTPQSKGFGNGHLQHTMVQTLRGIIETQLCTWESTKSGEATHRTGETV